MKTSPVHKVKEELIRIRPSRRCCSIAELSALLHMEGAYAIRGSSGHLLLTESASPGAAKKIYTLIHSLFELKTPLVQVARSTPRKGHVYRLEIPEQPGFHQFLNELGVLDTSLSPEPFVPSRLTRSDCCKGACLRGAFIGGGYVSGPVGPPDFEITTSSRESALPLKKLFEKKGLEPGLRRRRAQWVIYMKSRQQVSTFLAVVGAHGTHLEWESQSIISNTKNSVNRLVNCDAANARRLAEASHRQRESIKRLEECGALEDLPPDLVEIARLRMEHPQASLAELGKVSKPPVSKAVVQGRMRKIEALSGRI